MPLGVGRSSRKPPAPGNGGQQSISFALVNPPTRRKTDHLNGDDPLGDFWAQLLYTPNIAPPGTWDVRYEGDGQWTVAVWADPNQSRASLSEFFTRLGQALQGTA